jgi:hypothetical protein
VEVWGIFVEKRKDIDCMKKDLFSWILKRRRKEKSKKERRRVREKILIQEYKIP